MNGWIASVPTWIGRECILSVCILIEAVGCAALSGEKYVKEMHSTKQHTIINAII